MSIRNYLPKFLAIFIITIVIYITSWLGTSPALATTTTGTVTVSVANIRSTPNTSGTIAGTVYKDTTVSILSQSGEWYQVQCGTVTGWMHQSVLTPNSATSTIPSPNTKATTLPNQVPGVILDGQSMSFDVPPIIENGRILVPLAAIFRAMGATVSWDDATQTVTAVRGDTRVILQIDSYSPTVNGVVWKLDVPARIVNNRTLAPLRFVGEALGGTVIWDAANYTAKLTSPPQVQDNTQPVVAVNTGTNTVNLRGGPDTSYGAVDMAGPGETLKVLGQQGDWYLVNRGARNAWVAGWVVALIHSGEDIPAAAEPPAVNPSRGDSPVIVPPVLTDGVTLSSERTADGIRVIMESTTKLNPTVEKSSGQLSYTFSDRQLVGTGSIQESLGSSALTATGTSHGDDMVVTIKFPVWAQYETSTENNGKREVFMIPNCVTSVTRKTFGNGGESITINTTGDLDYTSTISSKKLEAVLKNTDIGSAQSSYSFSSSLIKSVTFKKSGSDTILTINTKQTAKFATGKTGDGTGLTIMFIDQAQLQTTSKIVVLDAGHGGRDPGASGANLKEKDVNLAVVLKAGKLLSAKGIKVMYTRQDDSYVDLDERSDMANLINAALFVSVHSNASTTSTPSGTETYCYYPESDPALYLQKEERYNLALYIQQAMIAALGTVDRGVKQGNLSVLRKTDMPSALVEMAFISNPGDEALLQQDKYRDKAAQAVANAIISYMKAYVD